MHILTIAGTGNEAVIIEKGRREIRSLAKELPGFLHERLLERTGVSIKRRCFEPESFARSLPTGNRHEYLPEDAPRLSRPETKAWRDIQRALNGRFCLVFGDGSLVHANAIYLRHGVDIVGR